MSKIYAEVPFRKISGFCYAQNMQLFWHEGTEETASHISLKIPESTLANNYMFKVDDNKQLELL